jgi:hypothetical protein
MAPRERLQTLYAVIRIDSDMSRDEDRVTVKEVVSSEEEAVAEVRRLNALRADDRSVKYFWQATRLIDL